MFLQPVRQVIRKKYQADTSVDRDSDNFGCFELECLIYKLDYTWAQSNLFISVPEIIFIATKNERELRRSREPVCY